MNSESRALVVYDPRIAAVSFLRLIGDEMWNRFMNRVWYKTIYLGTLYTLGSVVAATTGLSPLLVSSALIWFM